MSECKLTHEELREQELFEAAMRKRFPFRSLSYRYMHEDSREYDDPFTEHMFDGWLMRAAASPPPMGGGKGGKQ